MHRGEHVLQRRNDLDLERERPCPQDARRRFPEAGSWLPLRDGVPLSIATTKLSVCVPSSSGATQAPERGAPFWNRRCNGPGMPRRTFGSTASPWTSSPENTLALCPGAWSSGGAPRTSAAGGLEGLRPRFGQLGISGGSRESAAELGCHSHQTRLSTAPEPPRWTSDASMSIRSMLEHEDGELKAKLSRPPSSSSLWEQ